VDTASLLIAALLGVVEGLTEFIPVSSTGHLILLVDLLGFRGPPGHVFEISIQLGAILAICWLYRERLQRVVVGLFTDTEAQRFATNVLVGFLPAMMIGAVAHGFIKSVLFSPWVVAIALVLGGFAILVIERAHPPAHVRHINAMTPGLAFRIGLCQTVAMIPGVSRSGATIMGALLLGVGREAATEFSFFLAIPTMFAATVYDTYKNWSALSLNDAPLVAVGFVCAFLSALLVVRTLIGFVSRNGFAPFAWYRIALGLIMATVLFNR
jgi:undecaprenyl-diphosphatase